MSEPLIIPGTITIPFSFLSSISSPSPGLSGSCI